MFFIKFKMFFNFLVEFLGKLVIEIIFMVFVVKLYDKKDINLVFFFMDYVGFCSFWLCNDN